MDKTTSWFYEFISSKVFFVFTVVLLIAQSVWLAFSAIFPLPFDEYYHIGLMKIYSTQWAPFIVHQPADASIYGDITRQPSYLYHYLMSFPYRFFDLFTNNQTVIIILLRLLNISMVCIALVLFRKLLLSWGVSRRITHIVLLAFVCTPIVPLLAAHNNYDNAVLFLTPIFLLLATKLIRGSTNLAKHTTLFLLVGMFAVLVKINFLPIFGITCIYASTIIWNKHRSKVFRMFVSSWEATPKSFVLLLICIAFVIVSGLFIERNGANLVRYKTIEPDCAQVQSEQLCSNSMVWQRNHNNAQNKPATPLYGNPASYAQHWVTKVMRGYYAIFSHTPTNVISPQEPYGPIVLKPLLPLPISIGYIILVAGLTSIIIYWRRLWNMRYMRFALVLCTGYMTVLWVFNYSNYLSLGAAQAIQARYTYPLLVIMFALVAQATNLAIKSRQHKTWLVAGVLFLYFYSGGITGYIIRSDTNWYWQNKNVISINQGAQRIMKRIIIN